MNSTKKTTSKTGRPRGRRAAARVPCDHCIARASETKEEGASIELCETCTSALHRPRRKQQPEQINKRKIRSQSNATVDITREVPTDPVDIPRSGDRQEQHSIKFFVQHSSPQLAGYFDSPFWQRLVLQAGQHEPAVRHAIAAIGALHEKFLTGSVNPDPSQDKKTRFALEQCNKSIQLLVKPQDLQSTPDLQLMLTACVLLTCFEALQGHCDQAMIHATQGYSLLQQYAMDPGNGELDVGAFAVELDQLCLLMRRRQTQGLTIKNFNVAPETEAINAKRPTVFNSLEEARSGLEAVLNQLTVYFLDMELDDHFYDVAISNAEKKLLFVPWLASWETAFSTYLAKNQSTFSTEEREAAMILKAHELVAEIFADVDLSLGAMGWDLFYDKFAAIVDLATAVLDDNKKTDACIIDARWKTTGIFESAPTATFSISFGIVDPLCEVCSRCRDPILRRRALDLLATHPRQELVWSSWSAWKVSKFLMRLGEEGSETQTQQASNIPAERITSDAWADFAKTSFGLPEKSRSGCTEAVPRASARYALNPGLFENWNIRETAFGSDSSIGSVRSDSTASTTYYTLSPDDSALVAAVVPDDFTTWAWDDFEGIVNIPSIVETPPED